MATTDPQPALPIRYYTRQEVIDILTRAEQQEFDHDTVNLNDWTLAEIEQVLNTNGHD